MSYEKSLCRQLEAGSRWVPALMMAGLLVLAGRVHAQGQPPCVTVGSGAGQHLVCGKYENVHGNAAQPTPAFLGVRYATQALTRWKQAIPYNGTGIQWASQYGPICPQIKSTCQAQDNCGGSGPNPAYMSEDCLFLNVWTPPNINTNRNWPVMVFIHGGDFLEGGSDLPDSNCNGNIFDGAYLANTYNQVVVTFNYRLGALGFLASTTTNLTSGKYLAAGNFGLMDQQLAIKWVIDNISAFGGNPNNITLVGESAGAYSVGMHLLEATQVPNIQAGVMESNPLAIPLKNRTQAQNYFKEVMEALGCTGILDWQECFAKAQNPTKTPLCDILKAQETAEGKKIHEYHPLRSFFPWAPIVGGPVYNLASFPNTMNLPEQQPLELTGNLKVPLILGTNRNEGLLFVDLLGTRITQTKFDELVGAVFYNDPSVRTKVKSRYCPAGQTDCTDGTISLLGDYVFTCANQYVANQVTNPQRSPSPVSAWAYQFNPVSAFYSGHNPTCCQQTPASSCPTGSTGLCGTLASQCGPQNPYCCLSTTCHGAELPYVFGDTTLYQGWTPGGKFLSGGMTSFWSNFVSGHNPDPSGQTWKKYSSNATYLLMSATENSPVYQTGQPLQANASGNISYCSETFTCYPDCASGLDKPKPPAKPVKKVKGKKSK